MSNGTTPINSSVLPKESFFYLPRYLFHDEYCEFKGKTTPVYQYHAVQMK